MRKSLYIIASRFENITGGLSWTNALAAYARAHYPHTRVMDLSKKRSLFEKSRLTSIFYYLWFFLPKERCFIFIDHRLHVRFNFALMINRLVKNTRYATICHHVLYKTKTNAARRLIERISEIIFLHAAERIVVPSRETAEEVAHLHADRGKVAVINPTCTCMGRGLLRKEYRNNLLFVGNLEERKGVDIAIRALGRLADVDFTLHVAGGAKDERYLEYLRRLSAEQGISAKVFFHGRLDAEELIDLYEKANVFLFPSRYEGYGIVLLEAMSFGLPIVATDIPTTREIIKDGTNGYLSLVDDAAGMAAHISRLLRNRRLQRRIGAENARVSKRYRSWDDVAESTFEAFVSYLG